MLRVDLFVVCLVALKWALLLQTPGFLVVVFVLVSFRSFLVQQRFLVRLGLPGILASFACPLLGVVVLHVLVLAVLVLVLFLLLVFPALLVALASFSLLDGEVLYVPVLAPVVVVLGLLLLFLLALFVFLADLASFAWLSCLVADVLCVLVPELLVALALVLSLVALFPLLVLPAVEVLWSFLEVVPLELPLVALALVPLEVLLEMELQPPLAGYLHSPSIPHAACSEQKRALL